MFLSRYAGFEGMDSLVEKVLRFQPASGKVVDFTDPVVLEKEMEGEMSRIHTVKELEELAEFVLNHSVHTSHPMFVNQLYGAPHPVGFAGAVISEKLNTNAHTYEVAPVFVLAERLILKEMRKLFYGSETGDGIFSPGGSMSNMYGFILARHRKFPEVKSKGIFGLAPMVIYTSEDAHYSVSKSANWIGFGIENVVKVKTDKFGQMVVAELEKAIQRSRQEGKTPLVVNATSGTTVLGAFDDLNAIAEVCKSEGVWLHCDAAWGGSFIFSERLKQECLSGIEKCDSIAWNAHKMLGAPIQCSVFITKYAESLSECNSLNASYLFQPDKFYPIEYDKNGDKGFQCGRKIDAFKLWFMWVALGLSGFGKLIENVEGCARYIADKIKESDDFILYLEKHQCTNVFFWYIPPRLKDIAIRDEAWWKDLGSITAKIKERMVLEGSMMLGYSPLPQKNIPNAFRLVLPACPPKTHEDMDAILETIVRLGRDL